MFAVFSKGFEYVVNPPVVPKVAFGTTMDREVMPVSGPFLNSFMRSNLPEGREQPSPIDYDCSKPIGFKVSVAHVMDEQKFLFLEVASLSFIFLYFFKLSLVRLTFF